MVYIYVFLNKYYLFYNILVYNTYYPKFKNNKYIINKINKKINK